jgi:hypothetical protein
MTVIPDKHTFTIWQGATFFEVLTLYETMDKTQPRNLNNPSAYKAEMVIRDKPKSNNIYLILATDNNKTNYNSNLYTGCSIVLPTDTNSMGQIKLNIDTNVTAAIAWKSAVYDLTITSPSGVTDALLYGGIKVNGV